MSSDPALNQALQTAQHTLAALQRMQEQTAQLHKQFLDSQEAAQRTLASLVAQQQSLFAPGATPLVLPPVALPVPVPVVTPAAPPMPVQAAAPPNSAALSAAPIQRLLLDIVAEKTGYPADMLNPAMSLDADLGIDSIKRVEILSAVQEKLPGAPAVKPEHLGTLRTLADVVAFLTVGESAAAAPLPDTVTVSELPQFVKSLDQLAPSPAKLLLDVVAEKTGYPADMLNPAMSLDADLGIDSIKRVEILSAMQERLPNAPTVKPEQLGTLRTLQDVIEFLTAIGPPSSAPMTQKIPIDVASLPAATDGRPSGGSRPDLNLGADKPRMVGSDPSLKLGRDSSGTLSPVLVPTELIDRSILQPVDLDLGTARPRVPLPSGKDVLVVGEDDALSREVVKQLASQGYPAHLSPWSAAGSAVPADGLAGLILLAPSKGTDPNLCRLGFAWLQRLGPKLRQTSRTAGAAAVMSVARLDGAFGLADLADSVDPTSGGLAGLVKTLRHEWPDVVGKAADVAPSFAEADPAAAAAAIVDEFLSAGPIEVGIAATHRCQLELARTVRRPTMQPLPLGAKDVILVTGGARGVTAEAAVALAQASGATFILTGRTPTPTGPEPDWSAGLSDEAELKKAIAERLAAAATPKVVGEHYVKLLGQREIRATVARIEKAGGKAAYFPVDVLNTQAVQDLIRQVRAKYGPFTGFVHGAGVLADRKIEALTAEQFDLVYRTKVDAARSLLDQLRNDPLKVVVLFSSTTARYGRVGQLAYAVANEVLNKLAQVEARRRPAARVVAVNWGPWNGGMVTPGLRKLFEAEGVGLIPLAEGGAYLVHELVAGGKAVEVTAMGSARTAAPSMSGSGSGPVAGSSATRTSPAPTPAASAAYVAPSAPPAPELALAFERTVDVATHPIVRSHVLDGRAVLPMVLHLEWLAHAAMHGNPGLVFHGFDSLRIAHGVMIEDGGSVTLRALAGKAQKTDKWFVVPVELRGKRRDGRDVIHSRAEIVLTTALPKPPAADKPPVVQPYPHPIDEVYKYFLFHGPDLHAIERVEGIGETGFLGTAYPAPPPAEWLTDPLRSNWVADPLVLDASFQMMILWSFAQHGAGSLPCFTGRYRQYRRSFPAGPARVAIRITRDNGTFARADIDYLDPDGILIAQLQDYECVMDPGLNQAFRRNQLAVPVKV